MSQFVVASAVYVASLSDGDKSPVQQLADRLLGAVRIGEMDQPCPFCDGRLWAPEWTGPGVQVCNRFGLMCREIRHTAPACGEFALLAEGGQEEVAAP